MTEKQYLAQQITRIDIKRNKIRRLRLIGVALGLVATVGLLLNLIEWYSRVEGDGTFTVPAYLALITAILVLTDFGFMLAVHFKLQVIDDDREIARQAYDNHCAVLKRANSPLPYIPVRNN